MDRSNKNRGLNIFLVMFVMTLFSCSNNRISQVVIQKYGQSFNDVRKEVGLSLLTDSFKLRQAKYFGKNRTYGCIEWGKNSQPPVSKEVRLNNDSVVSEQDLYMGQEMYVTIDGTFNELLSIEYNFTEKNIKYVFEGFEPDTSLRNMKVYNSITRELTKIEADSVLSSWGY